MKKKKKGLELQLIDYGGKISFRIATVGGLTNSETVEYLLTVVKKLSEENQNAKVSVEVK